MRSFTTRFTTGAVPVLFLTLAFGLVQAQAKTDYSGTWKANVEKSDFGAMPAPDTQVDTITQGDATLKVAVVSTGQMGDMNYVLNFATDGKESANNQGDVITMTSTAKWDADDLVIDTKGSFNGTDFTSKERWTLAADGKMLTMARHITSAMGEFDQKMVYDKTDASAASKPAADAKPAADPKPEDKQ